MERHLGPEFPFCLPSPGAWYTYDCLAATKFTCFHFILDSNEVLSYPMINLLQVSQATAN